MATTKAPTQAVQRPRTSQPKNSFSFGRFLLGALALIVWVAALAAVAGVIAYQYQHTGRIFQGVQVRGIDLSNLTVSEAEERLRVAFDPYPLAPVTVRYGDQTWVLTAADLGVNFDARSAAEVAYRVGRQPIAANDIPVQLTQLQANLQQQLGAYRRNYEVLAAEAIDRSAGLAWLENKAQGIDRPAAEATLRVDGLDVSSTSSQVGYSLDVIGTHEALYRALLDNQGETIDLQVKENKPLLADVTQAEVLVRQVLGGPLTLAAAEPDVDTPAPPPTYTVSAEELAPLVTTELSPQLDGSLQLVTNFDVSPLRRVQDQRMFGNVDVLHRVGLLRKTADGGQWSAVGGQRSFFHVAQSGLLGDALDFALAVETESSVRTHFEPGRVDRLGTALADAVFSLFDGPQSRLDRLLLALQRHKQR